jgi:hypothetical protein
VELGRPLRRRDQISAGAAWSSIVEGLGETLPRLSHLANTEKMARDRAPARRVGQGLIAAALPSGDEIAGGPLM